MITVTCDYRIVIERGTIYVEYRKWFFWRRIISGVGLDTGWITFKSVEDAQRWIDEQKQWEAR